jgi:Protein of unknown function (DUF3179)
VVLASVVDLRPESQVRYNHWSHRFRRKADSISMHSSRWRPLSWLIFVVAAIIGISLFFIPAFIIRPFAHQSASGLGLAMALRQWAPLGTLMAAIICLPFAWNLWRSDRLWQKIAISAAVVLVAFSVVMSRLNYFEWMFHPVDTPQFEAESASKLENGEMILAVRYENDARAYPIREMAYHHVLNDLVNEVPIAVTY